MYQRFIKRLLDIIFAILGTVLCIPVFLAIACWIKVDSRGPVFFRQERVGKDKRPFMIWKFRTMRQEAPRDVPTHLLKDSSHYITRSGRFLRKTSLDELPQLLNILVGQMSFIGPRPALWNQDDLIALRDEYGANSVLPGMGGWAQVNGRDELALESKAQRDGEYAQHVSFRLDVKCFVLTVVKVLSRDGVVEGHDDGRYQAHRLGVDE